MVRILFDTSAAIGLLEAGPRNEILLGMARDMDPEAERLYCAVTSLELCIGEHPTTAKALKLLSTMRCVPLDDALAQRAGRLLSSSFGKKRRQIPDAIIASTALQEDAWLWTLNERDFAGLRDLRMFSLELPGPLKRLDVRDVRDKRDRM
ncbi:MAG: PIN domain-containing protein [Elusimicrobia bacterium]|nr:PIN domain-containing protein [Elusimicrobiota bacterium]